MTSLREIKEILRTENGNIQCVCRQCSQKELPSYMNPTPILYKPCRRCGKTNVQALPFVTHEEDELCEWCRLAARIGIDDEKLFRGLAEKKRAGRAAGSSKLTGYDTDALSGLEDLEDFGAFADEGIMPGCHSSSSYEMREMEDLSRRMAEVGALLAAVREKMGLSTAELAAKADLPEEFVQEIEKGTVYFLSGKKIGNGAPLSTAEAGSTDPCLNHTRSDQAYPGGDGRSDAKKWWENCDEDALREELWKYFYVNYQQKPYRKIVILERDSVGTDISVKRFRDFGEVTIYRNTVTPQEVRERVRDADIVIANKAPMREDTLRDAPHVKLICEFATGYDNCDLDYCTARGIKVANARDYCTAMVAQHTFTLALALSQKLFHYDNYVKSGAYSAQDRFSNFDLPFRELEDKTWGIAGMGNIGRRVAKIASAFGCRVIFHSLTGQSRVTEYPQVDKDTLLRESDFLSLHCPLSSLSRNFIDSAALKKMKPSAVLLNVARGQVVDNAALYEALEKGTIAAAGLDVLEQEPLEESNPLSRLKDSSRLIITPHLAWASVEARNRCVQEAYENIAAFLRGEDRNLVNP